MQAFCLQISIKLALSALQGRLFQCTDCQPLMLIADYVFTHACADTQDSSGLLVVFLHWTGPLMSSAHFSSRWTIADSVEWVGDNC